MSLLFINAAFREDSRTKRLSEAYLETVRANPVEIKTIELGDSNRELKPLNRKLLARYNEAVSSGEYSDLMFDYAREFREADEIVIAAPFWNFSIPAVLHDYLELVCTQGITFGLDDEGRYVSLCRARKLTFLTTAGGYIPDNNHAYGYIKDLCEVFWNITELNYYKAEGLDVYGNNADEILNNVITEIRTENYCE